MRRHVRRHANSYARRAVDKQIRQNCGQNDGLFQSAIKIVPPLHRLLINVPEHLVAYFCKPYLGITHCSRRITVNRAEIALPVDKRITQRKWLCHSHHCIINSHIPVRMIFTEHLSNSPCRFAMRLVKFETHVVQRIEYAAVNRLQPIPYIRKSAPHYDAHGVIQIGGLHLLLYRQTQYAISHFLICQGSQPPLHVLL